MKLLLVGPYPPPHGGVSVHVRGLRTLAERSGITCEVLNLDPRAPHSKEYIKIRGALDLIVRLLQYTARQWTLHVHTNGHNWKSWLIALTCGLAAQIGRGCRLTLHSGLLPNYLAGASFPRRMIARFACSLYDRIICVNNEICFALRHIGISESKLEVKEAFLPIKTQSTAVIPKALESWITSRSPLLTTTMFMQPEYGYDVLNSALARLHREYPRIGCIVMGVNGRPSQDYIWHAGDLDHDLCLSLIAQSDIFVRPTLQDGDSISVREAVALGVPVVASNVGMRPPDAHLFAPGDVDGLVTTINRVIQFSPPNLGGEQ
ncbi:MAG: glycosyltransferase family 4 protein [Acidobacteria bacterium]|nr:glycosyltransferase family 4 protein [Acidobacteriota bacterium]